MAKIRFHSSFQWVCALSGGLQLQGASRLQQAMTRTPRLTSLQDASFDRDPCCDQRAVSKRKSHGVCQFASCLGVYYYEHWASLWPATPLTYGRTNRSVIEVITPNFPIFSFELPVGLFRSFFTGRFSWSISTV